MAEKDWIRTYFAPLATSGGAANLSDDLAELAAQGDTPVVATVDAMVEGVHFLPSDPLETVARKLVRVNVSDILSSGATPKEALLTLGWPRTRPEQALAAFAAAFGDELAQWGVSLIGGDTVTSPSGLFLSLTMTGDCLGTGPVRRGGAKAGDRLWVTGPLGGAKRGFDALQRGDQDSPFVEAYRVPPLPPREVANLIATHATAAMDISDGLLGDALQMAKASRLSVEIDLDRVPFAGGATGEEAVELASWGDDYQFLFAAPSGKTSVIQGIGELIGCRVACVGRFDDGEGLTVLLNSKPINLPERLGFEHE